MCFESSELERTNYRNEIKTNETNEGMVKYRQGLQEVKNEQETYNVLLRELSQEQDNHVSLSKHLEEAAALLLQSRRPPVARAPHDDDGAPARVGQGNPARERL